MMNGGNSGGELGKVYNGRVGSTTSSVGTEVIPRLVGIDIGSSYLAGHMSSPPSPSKTSMLVKTSGGATGTGAGGGEEVVGLSLIHI